MEVLAERQEVQKDQDANAVQPPGHGSDDARCCDAERRHGQTRDVADRQPPGHGGRARYDKLVA